MVLSDTGLYEYVQTGSQILMDVAQKLEAAQMTLYQGLQSAGKREHTARLIAYPLGQAADSCMEAKRQLERTWRLAKLLIRGVGKGKAAANNSRAFKVGGQVASGEDDS